MPKLANSEDFRARLEKAMIFDGRTAQALAEAANITPAYVSNLRTGTKQNPSSEVVRKLADALRVSFAWLITGEGDQPEFTRWKDQISAAAESAKTKASTLAEQQEHFHRAVEEVRAPVFIVPLVKWHTASMARTHEAMIREWKELVPTACSDAQAFCLEVDSDSMSEMILPGDRVVLMPGKQPWNECFIVAKLRSDGLVIRRFYRMGSAGIRLTAHNPRVPDQDFTAKDFDWIFPIHSLTRPLST